jgi:hypothetical protein
MLCVLPLPQMCPFDVGERKEKKKKKRKKNGGIRTARGFQNGRLAFETKKKKKKKKGPPGSLPEMRKNKNVRGCVDSLYCGCVLVFGATGTCVLARKQGWSRRGR